MQGVWSLVFGADFEIVGLGIWTGRGRHRRVGAAVCEVGLGQLARGCSVGGVGEVGAVASYTSGVGVATGKVRLGLLARGHGIRGTDGVRMTVG